jgi:hypothetical protein
LRRIESEFLAGLSHDARVEDLLRTTEWNLGPSTFSMHGHRDVACMPALMLAMIDAAPLLDQPLSKCCAFHPLLRSHKLDAKDNVSG